MRIWNYFQPIDCLQKWNSNINVKIFSELEGDGIKGKYFQDIK